MGVGRAKAGGQQAARVKPVPPVYRAIILELERRRLAVGISQERMSELMGTAERSYAKMLAPEAPSGRMVRWDTLQQVLDVLYADGCVVRIEPVRSTLRNEVSAVSTTAGTRRLIKAEAARWNGQMQRERMREIGRMGGQATAARRSADERSEMARTAVQARWAKARAAQHQHPA